MAKIALVMGATGLVGSELTKRLAGCAEYQKVVAFSRRAVAYSDDKISNQVLDFSCLELSADLFQGDVLFLCLGTTKKQAGSIEAQRHIDFDCPLQAASIAAANGVKHCVLVSSAGADRHSFSPYLSIKGDLEQQLKLLGFSRLSILQPSILLGARRHVRRAEQLGASLLMGLRFIPGIRRYRPIPATEVAEKMLQLSLQSATGVETLRLLQVFTE